MRRSIVAIAACLGLSAAAGLASCGGGGGGGGTATGGGASGPRAIITPPGIRLTDVQVSVSNARRRGASMRLTMAPSGAQWSNITYVNYPANGGAFCCLNSFQDQFFFGFNCLAGFRGDVEVGAVVTGPNNVRIEETVTVNCG